MNTKTDFKDFVDQYVIDEEFKMLVRHFFY